MTLTITRSESISLTAFLFLCLGGLSLLDNFTKPSHFFHYVIQQSCLSLSVSASFCFVTANNNSSNVNYLAHNSGDWPFGLCPAGQWFWSESGLAYHSQPSVMRCWSCVSRPSGWLTVCLYMVCPLPSSQPRLVHMQLDSGSSSSKSGSALGLLRSRLSTHRWPLLTRCFGEWGK